jgi:hypothetical protein
MSTLPGSAALAVACVLVGAAFFCPEPAPQAVTKPGYPAAATVEDLAISAAAWSDDDPDAMAALSCSHAFHWLPAGVKCEVVERSPSGYVRLYIPTTKQFLWCNIEALSTTHETTP